MILSGSIKVFLADEDGKEIVLSTMLPGEYFGELALIGDTQRSASVVTLEDSKFAIISKSALKACLANNPEMAFNIINGLINEDIYSALIFMIFVTTIIAPIVFRFLIAKKYYCS